MQAFSNIDHPLVRDGRSREERSIAALSPDYVKIDERSQEDILKFLNDYAQQVLLYKKDGSVKNWENFFDFSTPIQVALISKTETTVIQKEYFEIANKLLEEPLTEYIALVFGRILEIAHQINDWYRRLRNGFSLKVNIKNAVEINLQQQLKNLIALHNAARAQHAQYREMLTTKLLRENQALWKLNSLDFTAIDNNYVNFKGSDKIKFAQLKEQLDTIFESFFNVVRSIVEESPQYYQQSLKNFDAHTPHVGLLLAFLRLFELLQGDLNKMTRRHLDFFYRDILQLKEKPILPDKAHLIFETAPHLDNFVIKKGRLFTAGKDETDVDILFALDDEIEINQAQVESLRTLFLEPCETKRKKCFKKEASGNRVVNQVYAASVANSADGVGEKFPKAIRPSWKTLGFSQSKLQISDEPVQYQNHPEAILGFLLASPILLLEGGSRTLTFTFNIEPSEVEATIMAEFEEVKDAIEEKYFIINDISIKNAKDNGYPPEVIEYIESALGLILNSKEKQSFNSNSPQGVELSDNIFQPTEIFRLEFSGEKGWFAPVSDFDIELTDTQLIFSKVTLGTAEPAVLATQTDIHTQLGTNNLPAVKILLQKNQILEFSNEKIKCASVYHVLRKIKITDVTIEATVKDFKNVVIQNEAGVLDINK
ncbi:MAG: hypothetical protein AAF573_20195, partial [Bacteroidota bacterium]